jgi:uncharacterized protein
MLAIDRGIFMLARRALVLSGLFATFAEGLKVIPACPFVKAWIGKHPEYNNILRS